MIGHPLGAPSISQLEKHIHACALDTLNVFFQRHAKQRTAERHVTLRMVYEVLQQGRMRRQPEPDPRYPGLRCEMTRMVCGINLAVVVYVDVPRSGLLVITVYGVRGE